MSNISIFEICENIESVATYLSGINPEKYVSVILSKNKYYVESGTPMIRAFEKLIFEGQAKKFNLIQIEKHRNDRK